MAVTVDDLRAIYTTTLSDDALQVHLDTAEMVVDEQLRPNCQMSDARYDKITLYLAAHFAYISETSASGAPGALKRSKLGEADESYAVPNADDYGYESSRWGQMAIALDTCGILSGQNTNRGLKAQFRVVGDPSTSSGCGC